MGGGKVIFSKQKRMQGFPVKTNVGRNSKLRIEKCLITEAEFMEKLSAKRAVYQAMVGKMR